MKRKCIGLILSFVMVLSLLPYGTFAENQQKTEETQIQAVSIIEENFPDEIFRNHVKENFDTNKDNTLSVEEISIVKEIDVSDETIKNLEGIKYFVNLERLDCWNCSLLELELSGLDKLKSLNAGNANMESLDVSGCPQLEILDVFYDFKGTLDISGLTNLKEIYSLGGSKVVRVSNGQAFWNGKVGSAIPVISSLMNITFENTAEASLDYETGKVNFRDNSIQYTKANFEIERPQYYSLQLRSMELETAAKVYEVWLENANYNKPEETNISISGLNYFDGLPEKTTSYNAGAGTVTFIPSEGSNPAILKLENATINGAITLDSKNNSESKDIIVQVVGDNKIEQLNYLGILKMEGTGHLMVTDNIRALSLEKQDVNLDAFVIENVYGEKTAFKVFGEAHLSKEVDEIFIGIMSEKKSFTFTLEKDSKFIITEGNSVKNSVSVDSVKASEGRILIKDYDYFHNNGGQIILKGKWEESAISIYYANDKLDDIQVKNDIKNLNVVKEIPQSGYFPIFVHNKKTEKYYTIDGMSPMKLERGQLTLSADEDQGNLEKDGYHWDGKNYILTVSSLDGISEFENQTEIRFPNKEVTINVQEVLKINKISGFQKIKINGPGLLFVEEIIANKNGNIHIAEGAMVEAEKIRSAEGYDLAVLVHGTLKSQNYGEKTRIECSYLKVGKTGELAYEIYSEFNPTIVIHAEDMTDENKERFVVEDGGCITLANWGSSRILEIKGSRDSTVFTEDNIESIINLPEGYLPSCATIKMENEILCLESESAIQMGAGFEEEDQQTIDCNIGNIKFSTNIWSWNVKNIQVELDTMELKLEDISLYRKEGLLQVVLHNSLLQKLADGIHTLKIKGDGVSDTLSFNLIHTKTMMSDQEGHWTDCLCGKEDTKKEAHTFGEWITVKEATETEIGTRMHVCSICGYKETVEIPMVKPLETNETVEKQELDEVPEGLKDTVYNTKEKIVEVMKNILFKKLPEPILNEKKEYEIYDLVLMIEENGVKRPATKEELREKGSIMVTLPYPTGTNKNTHVFKVAHMLTVSMNGMEAGELELPEVILTDKGIQVKLSGLSPVMVSYTRKEAEVPDTTTPDTTTPDTTTPDTTTPDTTTPDTTTPDTTTPDTTIPDTTTPDTTTPDTTKPDGKLPTTEDGLNPISWFTIMTMSIVVVFAQKKKRVK